MPLQESDARACILSNSPVLGKAASIQVSSAVNIRKCTLSEHNVNENQTGAEVKCWRKLLEGQDRSRQVDECAKGVPSVKRILLIAKAVCGLGFMLFTWG